MLRRMLPVVEHIPFVPALALAAKVFMDSRLRNPRQTPADADAASWCDTVRRDGLCVVDGFLPPKQCARLRASVDALMNDNTRAVQIDEVGADHRLFLGGAPPAPIKEIHGDEQLAACAGAVLGQSAVNLATLASRLSAVPDNVGSGGGWHRDSFTNQFKAVLYISDVGRENGPFQYIRGSHRLAAMVRDRRRAGLSLAQNRVRDDQVQKLIAEDPGRLITATGPAGTLILADTTGLHRGMPIARGVRYVLTNYYYAPRTVTAGLTDHFRPILGVHAPYGRAANSSTESVPPARFSG